MSVNVKQKLLFLFSLVMRIYYGILIFLVRNNRLDIKGIFLGRLKVKGVNNVINISGKIRATTVFILGNNNKVLINNGNISNLSVSIEGDNHFLHINQSRTIRNSKIIMLDNATEIYIGEMTGIAGARIVIAGEKNYIKIGKNSMISDNVEIWATDSHSIIDKDSSKRLNADKPIEIEDHVWIGSGVKILKGVIIKQNSIVGMGSLVVSDVDENVISAGLPSRTLRTNVNWSIERIAVDISSD
ncbi:MAG: acyltransferase [Sulfurimonas sp.]|nr:acyltransferase [Sulfurimonas sp.]